MTVFSWGIFVFSFSFFDEIDSGATNQGEIFSRLLLFLTLTLLLLLLLLMDVLALIRFWLLTDTLDAGKGNLDLLLTEDNDLVTGWLDAKAVS